MGFGKKDIVKNISSKALISSESSSLVLEAFLSFIKQNKRHKIKISKFGTYYSHKSPARIGRNPKTKEEKSSSKKKNSKKTDTKKETTKEKTVVKSVAKVNKEPVDKVTKPSTNADTLGQISITSMVYLQMIPQTITIQETVVLTQEMIYEQDIGAFTSSDTYDSLISSSNSRWVRMVDVRPKHTFSGYGR